jgi:hypothetical protein
MRVLPGTLLSDASSLFAQLLSNDCSGFYCLFPREAGARLVSGETKARCEANCQNDSFGANERAFWLRPINFALVPFNR